MYKRPIRVLNEANMKAWEDVEFRYGPKLYSTKVSKYWIQDGIKIERFDDGGIAIRNYMVTGDLSEPVTEKHLDMFRNVGWEAGICSVCIDVFTAKLYQAKENLKASTNDRERTSREKRVKGIEQTLDDYYNRIKSL